MEILTENETNLQNVVDHMEDAILEYKISKKRSQRNVKCKKTNRRKDERNNKAG